jgi:hypothetical protein
LATQKRQGTYAPLNREDVSGMRVGELGILSWEEKGRSKGERLWMGALFVLDISSVKWMEYTENQTPCRGKAVRKRSKSVSTVPHTSLAQSRMLALCVPVASCLPLCTYLTLTPSSSG